MACEKDADTTTVTPDLDEEPACLLLEELIDGSTSSLLKKTIKYANFNTVSQASVLEYDEINNQFYETDYFYKIEYDANGNIIKTEAIDFRGVTRQRNLYEYNDHKQLLKWQYFYWVNGVMEEGFTRTFEYASPTQLKKLTESYPYTSGEASYRTYEYRNGLMHKILYYENNKHAYTRVLEYDDKKHPNRKHYLIHLEFNRDLIGYPFQHNITKETITVPNDTKTYVDYMATFTYNTEGYPLTQNRNYVMENRQEDYTYSYICKD